MRKMWALAITCVLILNVMLVNIEEIKIDKRKNVSQTNKVDYTLEFNPNTGSFYKSGSVSALTTSELTSMGISSTKSGTDYKITFNNVNLSTTKGVAFEICDSSGSTSTSVNNVEIVLVGESTLESSFDNEETVYSAISNRLTKTTFSGSGSLTATSVNMSENVSTYAHTIRGEEDVIINGGTFNLYANGSNGTAVFSQATTIINGGTITTHSSDKGDIYGIYGKIGVDVTAGTININTNSSSGMSCGLVAGFIAGSNGINVTGGDINISVEGNVTNLEDMKLLAKTYAELVEEAGTTVDSVIEYIDTLKSTKGITNVYSLAGQVNVGETAGMSDFTQIKEALINVSSEVSGYAIGAPIVSIGGADVDIAINGMHKNGLYASSSDGIVVCAGADVDIKGDIDRSGFNDSTAAATGLVTNGGKVVFDECNFNIELENSIKSSTATYGLFVRDNDMEVNTGANVYIDMKSEGYAYGTSGSEKVYINGGKFILRSKGVAYNGMSENLRYVSKSGLTPATAVLSAANDYEGIERVEVNTTSNKWNYKYLELGECYDFSLYVANNGKVYKDNASGTEISSTMLDAVGISSKVESGVVELTMDNVNFATSVANALTVDSDVKVIVKDGTVNRISAMSDGSEDVAVVMVQNMNTEGSGTLIVDNMHNPSLVGSNTYKNNIISTGDITNDRTNIVLTGLDNVYYAMGAKVAGNMNVNSGSIVVKGGYKTTYVYGASGNNTELRFNGGSIDVNFKQTSYQTGGEAYAAVGLEFGRFFIKGGNINLDIHTEDGSAYGTYCVGADSNNYRYDQSGGVVKISSKTDKTYDGSKYFSGGISNCDKVYVSDGSLEIESYRLVGSTPIISEESLKRIAISKAMDASGNEVSSPSVEDINGYRYILIEPIYCYLYQGSTGTLYKILGDSEYETVDEVGWYAKANSEGFYDLVLNGFSFSTAGSGGILCGDSKFNVILEEGSVNTIDYNFNLDSDTKEYGVGVYVSDGDMFISGKGTLNMNSRTYTADSNNTSKTIGIWCSNLEIKDGATVNFECEGPAIYGTYIDENTVIDNATVTSKITKTNLSPDLQGLALISKNYIIKDSSIYVTGAEKTLAIWSWDGTNYIHNSIIDVSVKNGGAIAGATSTVIENSTVNFIANDVEGGSYGIYTKEDMAQTIQMNNCKVYMDIVGSRCIGIASSSDMKLNNCVMKMYFDVNDGAAGIDCRATDKGITGNVYVDNCDVTIGILGTRTTADNQGIVSRFGSTYISSSSVDIDMDSGDGDGIHAGEYFSDYSNEYDNREINLDIKSSMVELDINGKDISEQCIGVFSTYGDMNIESSEIIFTNNRSSADGAVAGLIASNNLAISKNSSIIVAIEPESNMTSDAFGIYTLDGNLSIGDESIIGMHITGATAYGIKGSKTVTINDNTEMNIDIEKHTDMGVGIISDEEDVKLTDVKDSSVTVKASNVASDISAIGIGATKSNVEIEDSKIDIDAYAKSAMAVLGGSKVILARGDLALKGYSRVIGTTTLSLVAGKESEISAMDTRALYGSATYKDSYADADLVQYPITTDAAKYKYAVFSSVPMKYYMFNSERNVLSEVSYDGTSVNDLNASTWPSGLSVEDGKLVMKDFEFSTTAKEVINCVGDATVYVDGSNKLTVISGMDAEHTGIYSDGKLDIIGTETGKVNIIVKSMNDARGIASKKDLSISDTGVVVYTEGVNSKGVTSVDGKVSMTAANVDISTDEISDTTSTDKRYGVYASTGIDTFNTTLKIKAATSALFLTDTSASSIKGSVKASENYTDSVLSTVSDVNTSYVSNASKYKTLSVVAIVRNVVITWNDLEYECEGSNWNIDKGEYDNVTWSTKNIDGDMITVENATATESVKATFNYTPATGYEDVTGVLKNVLDDTDITNKPAIVNAGDTLGVRLELGGQLSADAADSVLGEVTVLLSE